MSLGMSVVVNPNSTTSSRAGSPVTQLGRDLHNRNRLAAEKVDRIEINLLNDVRGGSSTSNALVVLEVKGVSSAYRVPTQEEITAFSSKNGNGAFTAATATDVAALNSGSLSLAGGGKGAAASTDMSMLNSSSSPSGASTAAPGLNIRVEGLASLQASFTQGISLSGASSDRFAMVERVMTIAEAPAEIQDKLNVGADAHSQLIKVSYQTGIATITSPSPAEVARYQSAVSGSSSSATTVSYAAAGTDAA